jgi:hypothetical protein
MISPFLDLRLNAPSVKALANADPMVTEAALRRGGATGIAGGWPMAPPASHR